MESYNALKKADEARTFPSISLPPPLFKIQNVNNNPNKKKEIKKKPSSNPFPGLLQTKKTELTLGTIEDKKLSSTNVFTGFSSSSVKLDIDNSSHQFYDQFKSSNTNPQKSYVRKGLTSIDMFTNSQLPKTPNTSRGNDSPSLNASPAPISPRMTNISPRTAATMKENRGTMEQLRSYISMMDQYSLHNFIIYEGNVLKETPEYQSFLRQYSSCWGSISYLISLLEDYLSRHNIKLAIINGQRLVELSRFNLSTLNKQEINSCLANLEQIQMHLENGITGNSYEISGKNSERAVIKIQSIARMYLVRKNFINQKNYVKSIIKIQSNVRKFLQRLRYRILIKQKQNIYEENWNFQMNRLKDFWKKFHDISQLKNQKNYEENLKNNTLNQNIENYTVKLPIRYIILIPSITISEYLRIEFDNFAAMQNTLLSNFYQLIDPNTHIIYVSPINLTNYHINYIEKFLALMGISILPKRLTFIVPEMINKLPSNLSLAHLLWYSPLALKKINLILNKQNILSSKLNNNIVNVILSKSMTWVEKRLSSYFQVPLLGAEPMTIETISSKSYLKSIYMDSNINIPIGSHDIYSTDDLLLALTRLIASNILINNWIIRLNNDNNNESCLILNVEKFESLMQIRTEHEEMLFHKDAANQSSQASNNLWYGRAVQLNIRKRILLILKREFLLKVKVCRKDIYTSWEFYNNMMKLYGAIIEAEPINKIGDVQVQCFINPIGEVNFIKTGDSIDKKLNIVNPTEFTMINYQTNCVGLQVIYNENYQISSFLYPQYIISSYALLGVCTTLGKKLHEKYGVIGFVTFNFIAFWDNYDKQPRLWANDISFGINSVLGAMGTLSVLCNEKIPVAPLSLLYPVPQDRCILYIPLVCHTPLIGTYDDAFFKFCRLNGLAYDIEHKVGAIFFQVDSIVSSGCLSLLLIGKTRKKAITLGIQILSLIQTNYGMDYDAPTTKKVENLTKTISLLKKILKIENTDTRYLDMPTVD